MFCCPSDNAERTVPSYSRPIKVINETDTQSHIFICTLKDSVALWINWWGSEEPFLKVWRYN
jgi:hypothetical protein